MQFLNGLTLLLIFQLIGEALSLYFSLSIPGPVIGMLLLFLTLLIFYKNKNDQPNNALTNSATTLLSHLSLLFIPAGTGLIVHIDRLEDQWLPIIAALVIGSIITMVFTAWLMLMVNRLLNIEEVNNGK